MENNDMQKTNKENMTATERRMATADLKKLILRYSIPTVIGMLVNAFYNVVDRLWVGKIDGQAGLFGLAGIGLSMAIMTILMGTAQLVGTGGAAVISIHLGRKDRDGAEKVLGNALSSICILAVIVSILGLIFMEPILILVGADENTLPYAIDYIRIILAGASFNMVAFAMNHCLRATGNPKRFAFTQILGAITNMILDPILIFGFDLGIKGAAYATIIAQFVSFISVMSYYFTKGASIKFHIKNLVPRLEIVGRIFSIGLAPFLMQVCGSFVSIVVNRTLIRYGSIELSSGSIAVTAFTIINSISTLFVMPIIGINQGSQPIIGYNYGARNYKRTKEALKWSIIYAMSICIIGFIAVQLFAPQLVAFFNDDEELVRIGSYGARVLLFALPLIGFQIPASNFFQSIGRAGISIFLSLLRQVILLIPLYLILPMFFGFNGIWFANPISDTIAGVLTFILVRREFKILDTEKGDIS